MADSIKQPVDGKKLRALIHELLLEFDPTLKNDPQRFNNIIISVEQDFYALAQNRSELVYQSVKTLEPLIEYLVDKQVALHSPMKLKPNPMKSLQKKCDDIIEEICRDEEDLKLQLKNMVKQAVGNATDPSKGAEAINTLHNLHTVLKHAKVNFTLKPVFEFLSDKDKANISYYAMNPETGSHATTLTKTEPSPHVILALTDAIVLTIASKLESPGQPIDEFGEIQKQNEGRALPTPFDKLKIPKPD